MKPSRIGPYRVEDTLGAGGMGEVYRAFDERFKRPVAIKRMSNPMAKKGRERERLLREARAVGRLGHPAIIRLFDLVESDEGDWLVMELVEGSTLTSLLATGPLGVRTALRVFHQIVTALAEAHSQGILHRDLKTDNIMVTADGQAKLLDFGLALAIEQDADESRLTIDGRILGTPHAMSPEQAMSLDLDHRSDLFSLGAMLYQTLTGLKPFQGADLIETLKRVCFISQEPAEDLNPRIPGDLSELLDQLLEKDPDERPQDTREVAGLLERWFDAPAAEVPAPAFPAPDERSLLMDSAPTEEILRDVRRQELQLLQDRWRLAAGGVGQVVVVSGEVGSGRSLLVSMLGRQLKPEATWLVCRCSPFTQSRSFAPFLDLLGRRLGGAWSDDPEGRLEALTVLMGPHAAGTGVVPLLASLLASSETAAAGVQALEDEPRQQILETLLAWLRKIADQRPMALVTEELQWADPATVGLLGQLVSQAETTPILLVFTCHATFQPPWRHRSRATCLSLG